jgi:hypothetical protein
MSSAEVAGSSHMPTRTPSSQTLRSLSSHFANYTLDVYLKMIHLRCIHTFSIIFYVFVCFLEIHSSFHFFIILSVFFIGFQSFIYTAHSLFSFLYSIRKFYVFEFNIMYIIKKCNIL